MESYRDELLKFVQAYVASNHGQMTLTRVGPTTYPDPEKTSWNDSVSWRVEMTFGRGYFNGAVVRYVGRWNIPRTNRNDPHDYAEATQDVPIEEAVDSFLSDTIPEWVIGA